MLESGQKMYVCKGDKANVTHSLNERYTSIYCTILSTLLPSMSKQKSFKINFKNSIKQKMT